MKFETKLYLNVEFIGTGNKVHNTKFMVNVNSVRSIPIVNNVTKVYFIKKEFGIQVKK